VLHARQQGDDQAADEVRGLGYQPQPHQLEPRADGALIGDVAGPAVHGHPGAGGQLFCGDGAARSGPAGQHDRGAGLG
jgi:hypothetical protein